MGYFSVDDIKAMVQGVGYLCPCCRHGNVIYTKGKLECGFCYFKVSAAVLSGMRKRDFLVFARQRSKCLAGRGVGKIGFFNS
ncbi:MAG: hypothetical protein UW72_C0005G0036 [Parcubacteria group bacterium GW2011_GWF2_44_7]|nr:MAG: hypothetical protein UW72_C0005G0036 [Parcubacteria group bacterium GW2011_GWF2_44_7]